MSRYFMIATTLVLLIAAVVTVQMFRPVPVTQFVALAFDSSEEVQRWQETLDFAKENKVRFTYFVSGPMFLSNENADYYQGPMHPRGTSDIGFGGSVQDVAARIEIMRRAYREGHEIASHANGHWDGSGWSKEQWISELEQFRDIMANTHAINGLHNSDPDEWRRIIASITGLRAPLLAVNDALYQALPELGYTYDTSRTHQRNYWPEQLIGGVWNFPLAELPLEQGGAVISMDYSFSTLHEEPGEDPQAEMAQAYAAYFDNNYNGSRAPIHIGHHFSLYFDGAYWRAMQNFAQAVCRRDDVNCGTYSELAAAMPSLRAEISSNLGWRRFLGYVPW